MSKSVLATGAFWIATGERALKTAAQAPLVAWAVGDGIMSAFEVDYAAAAGIALGGAVLSVLTSLASIPIGGAGPSLTSAEQIEPAPPAPPVVP